jgi:hypothetical protein
VFKSGIKDLFDLIQGEFARAIVIVDPTLIDDNELPALLRDVSSPNQFGRVDIHLILLMGKDMRYAFMLIVARSAQE